VDRAKKQVVRERYDMYKSHEHFPDDVNDDDYLWRYVDLARYADLLQTSELHLARADSMSDAWEGSFSATNISMRPHIYRENWETMAPFFSQMYMLGRTHTFLNCWHLSNVESAAMWSIYDREQRGVSIRTTHGRLRRALSGPSPVYGCPVEYIDYQSHFIPENNIFAPYRFKRTSFAHEREYRLMGAWFFETTPQEPVESPVIQSPDVTPLFLRESVDLVELVESVRVSPDAPSWVLNVVERLTQRYGQSWPVTKSDLAIGPIYCAMVSAPLARPGAAHPTTRTSPLATVTGPSRGEPAATTPRRAPHTAIEPPPTPRSPTHSHPNATAPPQARQRPPQPRRAGSAEAALQPTVGGARPQAPRPPQDDNHPKPSDAPQS